MPSRAHGPSLARLGSAARLRPGSAILKVMLLNLTTSEQRVHSVVAMLIVAFVVVALLGYGLMALWLGALVPPVLLAVVLVASLVRGRWRPGPH